MIKYNKQFFLGAVALLASTAFIGTSLAQTTTTTKETVVTTPGDGTQSKTTTIKNSTTNHTDIYWQTDTHSLPIPAGGRVVNFMSYDANKDNILSVVEISKLLFGLYDTDGNELIDNIEYKRRAVVTVMPMEKNTTISYDFNGDGIADKSQFTYETFMQNTALTWFDKNQDGLSPQEFLDLAFNLADVNNDNMIDQAEWQGAYVPRIDKINKDKARYNK